MAGVARMRRGHSNNGIVRRADAFTNQRFTSVFRQSDELVGASPLPMNKQGRHSLFALSAPRLLLISMPEHCPTSIIAVARFRSNT